MIDRKYAELDRNLTAELEMIRQQMASDDLSTFMEKLHIVEKACDVIMVACPVAVILMMITMP